MNNLHSSPHKTAWQIERAKIFQRFCRQIQSQKAIGNSINKTAKRISRRWNGKPLKGQRLDHIARNNPGDNSETAALRDEIYKIVMAEVEARVP
jgi:aspartyl/asparaginyl beta-hydroxylase (cupin superfamily)